MLRAIDKACNVFLQQEKLGENPIYLARDPGVPIGLKVRGQLMYWPTLI